VSTGPQTYPGANTTKEWFQDNYPGSSMEVNVGVIHTTEGTSLPTYSNGAVAPTMTLVPDFKAKKMVAYQHFPIDKSGRALVNAAGGVETNTLNAFQVELVGTCDPGTHSKWAKAGYPHIYWPDAPEWAYEGVADLMRWLNKEHGIPLTSGLSFLAYPRSYGSVSGQRMSGAKWQSFKGWCGHQHVPENVHGDPGDFPIEKVLAMAKQGATAPAPAKPAPAKPVPAKPAPAKPKPAPKPVKPTSKLYKLASGVKPGARHVQVKDIQQLLLKLGYKIPGAVTDFYGPATEAAVAAWHERNPKYKSYGVKRDTKLGAAGYIALQKQCGRR
jgi:hypothetical protein